MISMFISFKSSSDKQSKKNGAESAGKNDRQPRLVMKSHTILAAVLQLLKIGERTSETDAVYSLTILPEQRCS
jgi:hypothetical protein